MAIGIPNSNKVVAVAGQAEDVQVLVSGEPMRRREVTDSATLRAMSDPTRIAILRTLMTGAETGVRVMSAKELAAELGEPQTKLYRHLKQLEDAQLIEVAETRVVSGINEQRYRTAQLDLLLSPDLLADPSVRDDLTETVVSALDDFRDEMRIHLRAGRVDMRSPEEPGPGGMVIQSGRRRRVARARELRERLAALVDEFNEEPDDPDGIEIHLLVAWYGLTEPAVDG